MSSAQTESVLLPENGHFPNNPHLPLTIVRQRLAQPDASPQAFEQLFARNGWPPAWRAGIFNFDHYHSTAHEVLGCFAGSATLQFGGPGGVRFDLAAGDAVIIPAGVAHRCIESDGFICVGAYPAGQQWDTCYGKPGERPETDAAIAALGPWQEDPLA